MSSETEDPTSLATILEVSPLTNADHSQEEHGSYESTSVEGSVVASPSIESFSTFPDLEVSDSVLDSRDLQVKVDNPQKHVETMETYITFRITTKTIRPEFQDSEYIVRRRYNDFIWLRQRLVEWHPAQIIPPLPGKHSLIDQLDRYSKDFIIARMKLLHIFLNRLINHPIISTDKNLRVFLTVDAAEFQIHRKNRSNNGKFPDLHQASSVNGTTQRYHEFEQTKDYCSSLSEKLTTIDKISKRINKERQDYLNELHQFHPIFLHLADSEPELAETLKLVANSIEINAIAHQNLLDYGINEEQDIREYISYIEAVKEALARRDSLQHEYEIAAEELSKRTTEKDHLANSSKDGSGRWESTFWKTETHSEKLERLSQTIPRITKIVEVLQDRLQFVNEHLRADIERWNMEKRRDLKNILIAIADQQISHYQQCTDAWEDALTNIKNSKSEAELSLKSMQVFV